MNFEQEYQVACSTPTDINEHLPTLSNLVAEYNCNHVTELGVGPAQSTRAWLRHDIEIHSYELYPWVSVINFFKLAQQHGRKITLHVEDTRTATIAPTDILLIDSLHTYEQVKIELSKHANAVKKFLVFHDTTTYAWHGENNSPGIWPAIAEFLNANPAWQLHQRYYNNNGLTILKRTNT